MTDTVRAVVSGRNTSANFDDEDDNPREEYLDEEVTRDCGACEDAAGKDRIGRFKLQASSPGRRHFLGWLVDGLTLAARTLRLPPLVTSYTVSYESLSVI